MTYYKFQIGDRIINNGGYIMTVTGRFHYKNNTYSYEYVDRTGEDGTMEKEWLENIYHLILNGVDKLEGVL